MTLSPIWGRWVGGVCAEDFLPEQEMGCCIRSCSEEAGASLLVDRAGMCRRGLREGDSGCVGGHSRLGWQLVRLPGGASICIGSYPLLSSALPFLRNTVHLLRNLIFPERFFLASTNQLCNLAVVSTQAHGSCCVSQIICSLCLWQRSV